MSILRIGWTFGFLSDGFGGGLASLAFPLRSRYYAVHRRDLPKESRVPVFRKWLSTEAKETMGG